MFEVKYSTGNGYYIYDGIHDTKYLHKDGTIDWMCGATNFWNTKEKAQAFLDAHNAEKEVTMKKFKVGDKVRCIQFDAQLEVGKIYTVRETLSAWQSLTDDFIRLEDIVLGDTDWDAPYYSTSFELVEEESKFKVGDQVRYVKHINTCAGAYPESNKFYTVHFCLNGSIQLEELIGKEPTGCHWYYDADSFELAEEPKFKIGDKVRTIKECFGLTDGKIYTVQNTTVFDRIGVIGDTGRLDHWFTNRFELVTEEPKEPWDVHEAFDDILDELEYDGNSFKEVIRIALQNAYDGSLLY